MKRIISIVLTITMTISILASCGLEHFTFEQGETEKEENQYVTRAEWAEILGIYFGMDTCLSTEPYFADVQPSDAAFAYVQSCTEWEVFGREESNFNPDKEATVGFIIETAVKASEVDYSEYESPLLYAKLNGLEEKPSGDYVTMEYAMKVADWALQEYENKPFKEYQNIEYKEGLINLSEVTVNDDGTLSSNAAQSNLKVGDIVVTAPTQEDPYGVARKITSITYDTNGQAIIQTEQPEIGELFEELDFAYVGTVTDTSTIQLPEGVTLQNTIPVSYKQIKQNASWFTRRNDSHYVQTSSKGTNLSFSVNLEKGGKVTYSAAYNELKAALELGDNKEALKFFEDTGFAQLDDFKLGGDVQTVKATDIYEKGWELQGTISLSNFYVQTEVKTKKALGVPYGIQSFEYEINYDVQKSVKYTGKIDEEITIATVPIPLGSTGITIDIEISVNGSANGEIEISAKVSNKSTVKYTEKSGYKKTQSSQSENAVQMSADFKVGLGGKATLKALGIKLIDFKLSVGIGFELSGKRTKVIRYENGVYKNDGGVAELEGAVEDYITCIEGIGYYPTISLSLGTKDTLANKVGIKLSWKIMDKSGASFKSQTVKLHYEWNKGFVDECTLDTLEVFTEEEISEAVSENASENSQM